MKKNILIALIGFMCLQVGLVNAMEEAAKPTQAQLDQALIAAAITDDVLEIKRLIAAKANVQAIGEDGSTPLHRATLMGNAEIVKTLIEAKANIEAKNKEGRTPIFLALQSGVVAVLIEAGADLNARDNNNQLPIELLLKRSKEVHGGKTKVVRAYVTSVSPKDIQSIKPAIWAMQQKIGQSIGRDLGKHKVAKELIKDIVDKKMIIARPHLPNVPDEELRKEIRASIFRLLNKPAMQEVGTHHSIPIFTIEELLGTYDRENVSKCSGQVKLADC